MGRMAVFVQHNIFIKMLCWWTIIFNFNALLIRFKENNL
jgi:hypothetical protein